MNDSFDIITRFEDKPAIIDWKTKESITYCELISNEHTEGRIFFNDSSQIALAKNILVNIQHNTVCPIDFKLNHSNFLERKRLLNQYEANSAIELCTSGSTGTPKIVPLSKYNLYQGAKAISQSLNLTSSDVYLNVMPLFHIGGIMSMLACMITGGTMICLDNFDSDSFFDILSFEQRQPTWVYAAPTIYQLIVDNKRVANHTLRLMRSGAANLSHTLAVQMKEKFDCIVIPTYSMTECMPIASHSLNYDLSNPGTVGRACGCTIKMLRNNKLHTEGEGEVCVQGSQLMNEYKNASSDIFENYFKTGDLGNMSSTGILQLTGRAKEVIIKGGETVSPFEIEEFFLQHPDVNSCVCFSVQDKYYGENVAIQLKLSHHDVTSIESTICYGQTHKNAPIC